MCGGLQSCMDLGETAPSVCSETGLTVSAGGSEVCDIKGEEVLQMQEEEDHLAVTLAADEADDMVCHLCNIVVLTVVQAFTIASAFTVKMDAVCCFESLVPTHDIKHNSIRSQYEGMS